MQSLPYARFKTYVAGQSMVEGSLLNMLQDETVRVSRQLSGGDYLFFDDFDGSAVSSSRWDVIDAGWNITNDSANDGFGVVGCNAGGDRSLKTKVLPIGQRDFRIAMRWRFPSYNLMSATPRHKIGLRTAAGDAGDLYFVIKKAAGPVAANIQLQIGTAGATVDLGIPVISAFTEVELRRTAGVLDVFQDGLNLHSEAFAANILTQYFEAFFNYDLGAGTSASIYLDKVGMWVPRDGSIIGVLPSGDAGHVESGRLVFPGTTDTVSAVFKKAFAAADYEFSVTATIDANGNKVDVNPKNLATGGYDIEVSDPSYIGVVSWAAWKNQ